jgi:hypothetical protein
VTTLSEADEEKESSHMRQVATGPEAIRFGTGVGFFDKKQRGRENLVEILSERVNEGMTRRVILYPGEDGYVVAEVLSLPGYVSQGKTCDEALANIREAIALHL